MTPFQEFRFWLRRAPLGDRAAAAIASVLVLAVLTLVLIPDPRSSQDELLSGEAGRGEAVAGSGERGGGSDAAVPNAPAGSGLAPHSSGGTAGSNSNPASQPGSNSNPASRPGTRTDAGGSGSGTKPAADKPAPGATAGGSTAAQTSCAKSSAPGVTDNRIKIAIVLAVIVGPNANKTFGIASPEEQRAAYRAAIDDVNANGGFACRRVVPTFYEANPVDQNDLRRTCLDIVESGAFAVLDAGAYAQFPLVECYAQNKVPYFGGYLLDERLQARYYPYLFNFNTGDRLYRDTVFALRDRGFFKPASGFKKLGFIYRDCSKPRIDAIKSNLAKAGVAGSALVTYSVGCPIATAYPGDLQQAVLKFNQEGVTHVTWADFVADFANFTKTAQQQGFRPKYGLADESMIGLSYGGNKPDYDNLAGAIAITASRSGEETTPGITPSAGTARCNAVFKKAGLPTVYKQPYAQGNACSNVWMFDAALDNAPALQRTSLATGLQKAKSVDFSFPQGPNDFTGERETTGGQFWRVAQFDKSCNCWRVLDKQFKRTYA